MALYRVVTVFTGAQGSPWMNVMHFSADLSGTAQQAASAVATFWGACDALMDNSVSWVQDPTVVEVNEGTGVPEAFHTVTTGSGTGAVSDISLPYANQALIRTFSDQVVNGRQVRGRVFVPGITRNNLAEGTLNGTAIAAFDAAAAALIADANCNWQIWARPVDAEHATEHSPERAGTGNDILSASTSSQFAVLRRRRD